MNLCQRFVSMSNHANYVKIRNCQFAGTEIMPIIKSAKKKLRADLRKRSINIKVKTQVKSAIKSYRAKPTPSGLSKAFSALDIAVKKGVMPKKRANRNKSRFAAVLGKHVKTKPTSVLKKTKSSSLKNKAKS